MPLPTRLALVAHRFTTRICLQKKLQYASTLESRVRSEVRKQQHRLQFYILSSLKWQQQYSFPSKWLVKRRIERDGSHSKHPIPSRVCQSPSGLKCDGFCSFPARRFHPQQVSTFQLMCADCLLCQHSEISNMLLTRAVLPPSLWRGSPTTGYLPFKANDNFHIITFLALEETHWFVDSYVSLNMNLEILLLPFRIYSLFYICERLVEFAKKMYKYRVATLRKKKM